MAGRGAARRSPGGRSGGAAARARLPRGVTGWTGSRLPARLPGGCPGRRLLGRGDPPATFDDHEACATGCAATSAAAAASMADRVIARAAGRQRALRTGGGGCVPATRAGGIAIDTPERSPAQVAARRWNGAVACWTGTSNARTDLRARRQRAVRQTAGSVSDQQRTSSAPPDPPVIDVSLARRLIDGQFPQWSHLPITAVEVDGWDNRTFRLGAELTVRLPSGRLVRPAGRQGAALAAGARPAASAAHSDAGGQGRARLRVPVPVVGVSLARRRAGVEGADRRSARLRVHAGRVPHRPAPRRRDRGAGARASTTSTAAARWAPTRRRPSGRSTRSATRSPPTRSGGCGTTR